VHWNPSGAKWNSAIFRIIYDYTVCNPCTYLFIHFTFQLSTVKKTVQIEKVWLGVNVIRFVI